MRKPGGPGQGPRLDLVPWLAVALSLVLRIAYFAQIRENPFLDSPIMDEGYHDQWAREIAAGDLTSQIPFFRAPLYPFLLGLAHRVLGPDYPLIRLIQLLLGAITPALAWAVARRLAPRSRAVAIGSTFLVALDGILYYFEAEILVESLLAPLGTLFCLLLLRARETNASFRWVATGLGLGVFAITRPNILLFAPVALWLAVRGKDDAGRRGGAPAGAALVTGAAALILPVTAVNWFVGGDRVLVSSQAGYNFFLGNNAEANGWSATAPSLFRIDWWGGYQDSIRRAEEARGRTLRPSEVSGYWLGEAAQWWRENPGAGLALTARKIALFLSGTEFGNNRQISLFFREFAPLATPSLFLLYAVTPLALVGMVGVWRRGGGPGRAVVLFVVLYAVSVVLFFVNARFRVPLRPVLFVFAWEGGRLVWEGLRGDRRRGVLVLVGVLTLGVAANANPWIAAYRPSKAQFYQSVANVHMGKGDLTTALVYQRRTLELDPSYPEANLNLGTILMTLGDPRAAIPAFERERFLDPDDGGNLASLARAYDLVGRLAEAERTYAAAEEAGLEDAPALYNHALCLERLDRPEEAERLYRRAMAADSALVDARNNLGVLRAKAGALDEAVVLWEEVLAIEPGHVRASDNLRRARALSEGDG